MKAELQKKLAENYSEFFNHLQQESTPMMDPKNPLDEEISKLLKQKKLIVPMQFGFECGDGWYWLLDQLMSRIKWHIENTNWNRDRQARMPRLERLSWLLRFRTSYRLSFLKTIGEWLYRVQPRGLPHMDFRITQIKEKFGGLRFYYSGGDDTIDGMVHLAESMSYEICDICGTTEGVGRTKGWVYTICKSCYDGNERAQRMEWYPINPENNR